MVQWEEGWCWRELQWIRNLPIRSSKYVFVWTPGLGRAERCHRVERSSGSMMRQVKLPPSADTTRVAAAMENGVLHLTVPKKALQLAQ
jgi:hypothetical protein